MKNFKCIILAIFSISAHLGISQIPDTLTPETKARYRIDVIKGKKINALPNYAISNSLTAIADMAAGRVPFLTMDEVRAGKADGAKVVQVLNNGSVYPFVYDASSTAADDSATVIISVAKRFLLKSDYVTPEMFGAKGDGITDDTQSFRKAVNSTRYKVVSLSEKTYKLTGVVSVPANTIIRGVSSSKTSITSNTQVFTLNSNCKLESVSITSTNESLNGGWVVEIVGSNHEIRNNQITGKVSIVAPNRTYNAIIEKNTINVVSTGTSAYGINCVNSVKHKVLSNIINVNSSGRGIVYDICSEYNIIDNNQINGNNFAIVGILFNSAKGSKNLTGALTRGNTVTNNIVENITEEGISFDFLYHGNYQNTLNGFTFGKIDATFADPSTGRTILVDSSLYSLYNTGDLNNKYLVVITGQGAGQYSKIDINYNAENANMYLNTKLNKLPSRGDYYIIGNFATDNIIQGNKVSNCQQTGIMYYGGIFNSKIINNTVSRSGYGSSINTTFKRAGISCLSTYYAGNPFDSLPFTFSGNSNNIITGNNTISNKYGLQIATSNYTNLAVDDTFRPKDVKYSSNISNADSVSVLINGNNIIKDDFVFSGVISRSGDDVTVDSYSKSQSDTKYFTKGFVSDPNTITTTQQFNIYGGGANNPFNPIGASGFSSYSNTTNGWMILGQDGTSTKIKTRTLISGTWSPWLNIVTDLMGSGTKDASTVLQLNSTTQGFATPRMTTAQRDVIVTPLEGIEIYNLTSHTKQFWNGTVWKTIQTD